MMYSFSSKFEILSLSGLTWLTSVDQALEKTESPPAGELTECCNTGFSGWFRVALSKNFGCDDFRIFGNQNFKD